MLTAEEKAVHRKAYRVANRVELAKKQTAYMKTETGKAVRKAYRGSEAYKESTKRYQQSDKAAATKERFNKSRPDYNEEYYATISGYLRVIYASMKNRCTNPENVGYARYGQRGIELKFTSPEEFISYVINVLQVDPRGLDCDRIDSDGHYELGNIQFLTRADHAKKHVQENGKIKK